MQHCAHTLSLQAGGRARSSKVHSLAHCNATHDGLDAGRDVEWMMCAVDIQYVVA